jgi:hypothetical protein
MFYPVHHRTILTTLRDDGRGTGSVSTDTSTLATTDRPDGRNQG